MTALRPMVRIGWPAGLQGAVFSISNLVIQSAINSLGADAMAGSVAAFTIEINIYCFINAFGLAATTFVSQNYGAKNLERCKRATYVATGLNMVATVLMVALVLVFGRTMLGLFTDVPAVVELAMARIFWVASFEPISVLMEVSSSAMRGYGYSMPPAMATLICVCSVRLIWVCGKPRLRDPDDRLSDQLGRHRRAAALPLRAPHEAHQAQVRGARLRSRSRLTSCPSTKTATVKAGAVSVREDFQRLCRGLLEVG